VRSNSSRDLVVTSSGSPVGTLPSIEGQRPFCSVGDFRRALFSLDSPVVSEINPPIFPETEFVPVNTTYTFTLPAEMAHLMNTTSVPTGLTTIGLAPINTQRTPSVFPTLPPGYHMLNALLNSYVPTSPQTLYGTPGGPSGHPIPGFYSDATSISSWKS
jgi:hypothetical protein